MGGQNLYAKNSSEVVSTKVIFCQQNYLLASVTMRNLGEVIKQRVERVIVENEMLRAGFAALPYVVLRDTKLSIGARLTYAILLSYAWQEDSTFVGQAK